MEDNNSNELVVDNVDFELSDTNRVRIHRRPPVTESKPLKLQNKRQRSKNDHRSSDVFFFWIVDSYGDDWEEWRSLFADWVNENTGSINHRLDALTWLFVTYLEPNRVFHHVESFFDLCDQLPNIEEALVVRYSQTTVVRKNNLLVEFLDWVKKTRFTSIQNGHETASVSHPYKKLTFGRPATETCKSAMPYKYIREIVDMLCPNKRGDFKDWQLAKSLNRQDWFIVSSDVIDEADPDCIWEYDSRKNIYKMWSPVRTVALYVLLHLPLRSFQVRMLDSGEADTWRYEGGNWVINNKHKFIEGTKNCPVKKGVFRRIKIPEIGVWETGLYINTNKTADLNKELHDKGYVIPWKHEDVLFWLEKLRNWQEKYNPVEGPISWLELTAKHLGNVKAMSSLAERGMNCFLFRDPCDKEKNKPLVKSKIDFAWVELLRLLEERVFKRGETNLDNERLAFLHLDKDPESKINRRPIYPIHSLRVSLLTHYFMDGQVPLPVLSKLVAGHTRIFMTLYYMSISPNVMRDKMAEAEGRIVENQDQAFKSFLKDAKLNQIPVKCSYRDEESVMEALANRNPLGWECRHIGLCLAGGNSSDMGSSNIAGCWNGGEKVPGVAKHKSNYLPVPHGPENCVRCRWFITNVDYLDALKAHFNVLSYKLSLAADASKEAANELEQLEDERYMAESTNMPFIKQRELQVAERRYQKQIVEADEYAKDVRQCFTLICRILNQEINRSEADNSQKLVAVGTLDDIAYPISLIETESELFQLSGICENAEVYPDLQDELFKTPAIEKRSRILNSLLMKDGYKPIFMEMDERMQLIAGNAFMRKMANQVMPKDKLIEGLQRVCGYIESEQSLKRLGLLDDAFNEIAHKEDWPAFPLAEIAGKTIQSGAGESA
jgi:hypothetical protein